MYFNICLIKQASFESWIINTEWLTRKWSNGPSDLCWGVPDINDGLCYPHFTMTRGSTWHDSPAFVDSNEVIFKEFKQTFIKMIFQINKSYKFCYKAKMNFLDWASCATPLKPGRKFSTYLAQSKLLFGKILHFPLNFL